MIASDFIIMTTRRFTQLLAVSSGLMLVGVLNAAPVSLGEGLDNTNLVWTTGGDQNWFATNQLVISTFDGVDAAASGAILSNQQSWIETTVIGPGTVSFWWYVISEENADFLEFYIDGQLQDAISGLPAFWEYRSYAITNGTHTLRWRYVKDADFNEPPDKGYLDQVKFTSGPEVSLPEALSTPFVVWNTGGNANPTYWAGQTNVFRTDGEAAVSGAVTHGQESWMQATVTGVTNYSFWWKVSSETNYDLLNFYVDGALQFTNSGEVNWQLKTNLTLSPGTHTLRWAFTNDATQVGGQNRGWVDDVIFRPPVVPTTPITLATPVRLPDGQMQVTVNFAANWPCRVLYSTNLAAGGWTLLVTTNTTSAATIVIDPGATNSPARFYRAQSP